MPDDMLSWRYNDSQELAKKGDLVVVDDRPGRIEEICMPGSQLADYFNCKDTGGLLIRYEDGVVALTPFGHYHRITTLRLPDP